MKIGAKIAEICSSFGLCFDDAALSRMELFADLLIEKNKVMNLTAITEESRVAALHFADCLFLLSVEDFTKKRIIDIGCGGGFPSVPLLCAEPSLDITGVDSTTKRVDFVTQSVTSLGVGGKFISARAEEYALKNMEKFDISLSRAVAPLNILCELSMPLLKIGGKMLAMKSTDEGELENAKNAIKTLGGRLAGTRDYSVGEEYPARRVVIIEKIAKTPPQYPRRYAKIKDKPL